jgi:hypothetical protein
MPILFMALIALAVFVVMGLLLFYAAYAESHTPRKDAAAAGAEPPEQKAMARGAGAL